MAQPVVDPNWASDANFSSGPETGTPTKVSPGAGALAQGFVPGNAFVGPYINYTLYWICQWITGYLKTLHTQTVGFLNQNFTWTGNHTFNTGTHTITHDFTVAHALGGGGFHVSGTNVILDGTTRVDYVTPRSFTKLIPLVGSHSPQGSAIANRWYGSANNQFCSGSTQETFSVGVKLPVGSVITLVRAAALRNAASSGADMAFSFNRKVAATNVSTALTGAGSLLTFGGSGTVTFSSGTLAESYSDSANMYEVSISSSGTPSLDEIRWIEVTYTSRGLVGN